MRSASPVFIMGLGRSGTSLLYRTMQKHPAFRPTTINLQETRLMGRLPWAFRFDEESPRQLVRFMLKDSEHYRAFLEETRRLRRVTLLTFPVNAPLRGRTPMPLWRAQGLHLVARSYLWHAWAARGSQRLVEKTPGHVMYIDKLRAVSPECRLIFVIRHPVDCFSSFRKRAQVDPKAARWADLSLGKFVRRYRAGVGEALAQSEVLGEQLLLLRYEDFTSSPHDELRRLCDFLGEPFVESAIQDSEPDGAAAARGTAAYRHLYGAIKTGTKSWTDFVTQEEARLLETRLAKEMSAFGYSSYT
jgi:Sulfotransferase family